jgi:[NiFe] hydrogenase diaphorase moiety large subunit
LGIKFNEVTTDGLVGLFETSCIGMNDQEPAAIINNQIFTRLTPFRAKEIVRDIKEGKSVEDMIVADYGDGENRSDLIKSVVSNNIRKIGPILERNYKVGQAIEKITDDLEEVIDEVKINIRGRGGAGFPTGLNGFCRNASVKKSTFCNVMKVGVFKDGSSLELPGFV